MQSLKNLTGNIGVFGGTTLKLKVYVRLNGSVLSGNKY